MPPSAFAFETANVGTWLTRFVTTTLATAEPETLRQVLTLAHGRAGRVRKHRTLYLRGRTRLHLDRVEGLGDFLELEVVLAEGEAAEAGAAEARDLMARLGVPAQALVETAYVDLLAARRDAPEPPEAS